MVNLEQTIDDIKSLKIQGATKVAKAGLLVLLETEEKDWPEAMEQLIAVRPTEPMLQNCLKWAEMTGKTGIENILGELGDLGKLVTENGQGLIKDGMAVLTHCHSTTVLQSFKAAKQQDRNFKVYLTETRPLMQGRITAEELVKAGINATMITDSEAAMLVSQEDQIKIDLVLLGADAITKDGIYNKVGSYGIALAAHEANVPVYILTKLLKYSAKKVEIEEREGKEIWEEKPDNLKIFNPAFDFVPVNLIAGIVCEFGIIKPEEAESVVKKNYSWIMKNQNDDSCHSRESGNPGQPRKDWIPDQVGDDKYIKDDAGIRILKQVQNDVMVPPYKHYLHLNEKINKSDHLLAQFFLRVNDGEDFLQTAGGVGAESSVGTWTEVTTQFAKTWERLHARIIEADEDSGMIKIAYPLELFEKGNIPQLLSSVAGNIFGLKEIKNLKLLDLEFPEAYVKSFPGPAFGIRGIRKISGIRDRSLIGCIIKPKLGLGWKEHAEVALGVFGGVGEFEGVDFVKDDENLTSQDFNPFEKRATEVLSNLSNLPNWEKKIYAFNVTAETKIMLERAKFVKEKGGNCAMIDLLTSGFASVQSLRRQNLGLIIHGHRAMHGALTRDPNEGISMLVLAKLARLAGIDSLHTGTVVGKMEGGEEEVTKINQFLLSEWYGLKPVLPVASGGLYPNLIPDLMKILGNDVLLNFGGGIHGHPQGSKAGARAVRQAVEAVGKGISLKKYGETHEELKIAVEHWDNL